jgi:hypothetical protein
MRMTCRAQKANPQDGTHESWHKEESEKSFFHFQNLSKVSSQRVYPFVELLGQEQRRSFLVHHLSDACYHPDSNETFFLKRSVRLCFSPFSSGELHGIFFVGHRLNYRMENARKHRTFRGIIRNFPEVALDPGCICSEWASLATSVLCATASIWQPHRSNRGCPDLARHCPGQERGMTSHDRT